MNLRTKTLLAVTSALIGSIALADGGEKRSEFFWQPGGSMNAVRVDWAYSSATFQRDTAGGSRGDANAWGQKWTANYQYGLTPDWALGAILATGQQNVEYTPLGGNVQSSTAGNSGLYDLMLIGRNTTPMGWWRLHYGMDLNISLGAARMASRAAEGTNQSGGIGARPYVGASMDLMGMGIVGASFGYWWKGDRNMSPQLTNYSGKMVGGSTLDFNAFYEYHADMWLADIRAGVMSIEQTKYTLTPTNGSGTDIKADAHTNTYVAIGGQYYFMPAASVRVSYQMDMSPDFKYDQNNNLNEYAHNSNTFNIAGRYEF